MSTTNPWSTKFPTLEAVERVYYCPMFGPLTASGPWMEYCDLAFFTALWHGPRIYHSVVERLNGGLSEVGCGNPERATRDPSVILQSRNPSLRLLAVRG